MSEKSNAEDFNPFGALQACAAALANVREAQNQMGRLFYNFGGLIATGPNDASGYYPVVSANVNRDIDTIIELLSKAKVPTA